MHNYVIMLGEFRAIVLKSIWRCYFKIFWQLISSCLHPNFFSVWIGFECLQKSFFISLFILIYTELIYGGKDILIFYGSAKHLSNREVFSSIENTIIEVIWTHYVIETNSNVNHHPERIDVFEDLKFLIEKEIILCYGISLILSWDSFNFK